MPSCRARATSSLPLPVSPTISTPMSDGASRSIFFRKVRMAALAPIIAGFLLALACVGYLFAVAFSRSPFPLAAT